MVVLVYYKCSKLPKIDRQHILIIFQFFMSDVQYGFHQAQTKVLAGAGLLSWTFRENIFPCSFKCWQNSVPSHCSTDAFVFCWLSAGAGQDWGWETGVGRWESLHSRSLFSSCTQFPSTLHLKTSKRTGSSCCHILLPVSASFLPFMRILVNTGYTWISPGIFPLLYLNFFPCDTVQSQIPEIRTQTSLGSRYSFAYHNGTASQESSS